MRWSEDGSEVSLDAAEFRSHMEAMETMRNRAAESAAKATKATELLDNALKADVVVYQLATAEKLLGQRNESCRKALAEFENAMRVIYPFLDTNFSGHKMSEISVRMASLRNV